MGAGAIPNRRPAAAGSVRCSFRAFSGWWLTPRLPTMLDASRIMHDCRAIVDQISERCSNVGSTATWPMTRVRDRRRMLIAASVMKRVPWRAVPSGVRVVDLQGDAGWRHGSPQHFEDDRRRPAGEHRGVAARSNVSSIWPARRPACRQGAGATGARQQMAFRREPGGSCTNEPCCRSMRRSLSLDAPARQTEALPILIARHFLIFGIKP